MLLCVENETRDSTTLIYILFFNLDFTGNIPSRKVTISDFHDAFICDQNKRKKRQDSDIITTDLHHFSILWLVANSVKVHLKREGNDLRGAGVFTRYDIQYLIF